MNEHIMKLGRNRVAPRRGPFFHPLHERKHRQAERHPTHNRVRMWEGKWGRGKADEQVLVTPNPFIHPSIHPSIHPLSITWILPSLSLFLHSSTTRPYPSMGGSRGYLLGAATSFKYTYDTQDGDVFFCTADCGWITGHSYVAYGPLLNGATQVSKPRTGNASPWEFAYVELSSFLKQFLGLQCILVFCWFAHYIVFT